MDVAPTRAGNGLAGLKHHNAEMFAGKFAVGKGKGEMRKAAVKCGLLGIGLLNAYPSRFPRPSTRECLSDQP